MNRDMEVLYELLDLGDNRRDEAGFRGCHVGIAQEVKSTNTS